MIFEKVKLSEVCKVNSSKRIYLSEYVQKGIPFYRSKEIIEKSLGNQITTKLYISKDKFNEFKKKFGVPIKGDILITAVGTLGRSYLVKNEEFYFKDGNLIWFSDFNNKIINNIFLLYLIKTEKFQNMLDNISIGSTQKALTINSLKNIEIKIYTLENQTKIAHILSTLDAKIQLNNDMNNNLLKIINIEFDNYLNNLESYKELSITEIFDFEQGIEPGSKNYFDKLENGFIKFYRVGDMNLKCKTYIPFKLAKNRIVTQKDILVSFDATVGRIAYGINGAYSTGMKKITVNSKYCNDISNSLVFAYFNNKSVQDIINQHARGTTILHASSSINFMKLKYNREKIGELNNVIDVMFNKMIMSKIENENLINLRDTLLPKLMNGEIDLDNLEL